MTYKKQIYCVTSFILCTLAKGMKFLTILLQFLFITHVKLTIENIEKLLRAIFMFANGDYSIQRLNRIRCLKYTCSPLNFAFSCSLSVQCTSQNREAYMEIKAAQKQHSYFALQTDYEL